MTKALVKLQYTLQHKLENEKGATAVEYGLFVALIAAVIVGVVVTLGQQINTAFLSVSDAIAAAI